MGLLDNASSLKYYIFASNLVFTLLPLLSYYIFPTFSPQNNLILHQSNPLSFSISFDATHFLTNQYKYEKNYAFLPGFVLIVHFVEYLFSTSLAIVIILIINKICTALTSIILMNIVSLLSGSKGMGLLAGAIFLFNPVAIFFHTIYSQAIYSMFTFAGIYLFLETQLKNQSQFEESITNPLLFLSTHFKSLVLLGISCSFRTTGVFICMMYGIPILQALYKSLIKGKILDSIKIVITGASVLFFFLICLFIYLYHGYKQFCKDNIQRPSFCQWTTPNIYQYVQIQFWNCGFLQYYDIERAFFIFLGMPSIIVSLISISGSKQFGLNLSYYVLVFITISYSNIQSSARFFSTHPLYFYGLAKYLAISKQFKKSQKIVIFYLILYNFFGIVMFPHRFVWT